MEEKKFSALYSALQELDDPAALENLQAIKEHVDNGTFFVAFIGQYSAGKSSLINNILGRQIFPSGSVETTPILSYILYGEDEGGRLVYLDGHEEDISLDEIMNITQSNNSAVNLSEVEHMEIFLNEKILSDGMILLDTPGINTLIQRHEFLLANSLSLASAIFYVVSGAPSRVDVEKLQDFAGKGFPISFVRTHCDEIKDYEETYQDVVNSDKAVLKDCNVLDNLENCFFVSNIAESKYFAEIGKIRDLLQKKGANAQIEIEKAASARLEILCNRAIKQLRELHTTLGQQKNQRTETIEKQRKKIDDEIKKLECVLNERQERLQNEVEECQATLKKDLNAYAQKSADDAAKIIEAAGNDVKDNQAMAEYAKRKIRPILNHTFEIINLQISPILKNINGVFQADGNFENSMADSIIEDLPEMSSYSEVVNFQDSKLDSLRRSLAALQENRQQIQMQIETSDESELQNELLQLEQELESLKNERDEMGVFQPKMIQVDEGSTTGSTVGRAVGNLLDWAMIFTPQGTIKKLVTAPTLLQRISKIPTTIGKYAKAIATGKSVTKTYATAKRIKKAEAFMKSGLKYAEKAKEAGILDYLSIEHWGEKLGSQFDRPPVYEEDLSYRRDFIKNKKQIEQNILKKQQDIFQKKQALGAFRNEIERKAALLASREVDSKELNRQLQAQESKLKKDAEKKARQDWKKQWANYYHDVLPKFLIEQAEQYLQDLPKRLAAYQAQKFAALEEKLSEKKAEYESLANLREDDVAEKFQRTEKILRSLESVM